MKHISVPILLLPAIFLTGCFENEGQSAQDFIREVKQQKSAKVQPLPEIQEYKAVEYHAANLRNPFQLDAEQIFVENRQWGDSADPNLQQSRPDSARKRELLESYSLDTIVMVGVIKKGNMYWGIVKDKTGTIHRVHVGNYLGENSGCIENITTQNISIKETIADGQGGWTDRKTSLSLNK